MSEDYCDPGIQASDVFTLQYFLLSIIILPIAYTKYKQFAGSGYKDIQAKQLYLKYLATFFSCSVIFSFFVGFIVKDVQKTILVSLNTLLMMTILFSGLSEKNMKPLTATLSINLCFSIGCFIFYVIKIIKANPESAQSLASSLASAGDGLASGLTSAGNSLASGLASAGDGLANVVTSTGKGIKDAYQSETAKKAGQFATASINTVGDVTKTVAENAGRPFTKQNLKKNYQYTLPALKKTGPAKLIQATNQAVKNAKQDVIQNAKKLNPTNQTNRENLQNLGKAFKKTGLANMFSGNNKNQRNNQQHVRNEIAKSDVTNSTINK